MAPRLRDHHGEAWRPAAMPRSSSACATSSRSRGSRRPSRRPSRSPAWATPRRRRSTTSPPRAAARASAQALATRTFGFPLATDTAVVQRDPRGLSDDAQRRQADAALAVRDRRDPALAADPRRRPADQRQRAHAVGRARHDGDHLPALRARREPRRRGGAARHYAQQTLGGPRAAVVGVTGAAPAREAQFHEIEQALPLIEAASVVLIALIVGARVPLDRRPARGARGGGHRLRDRDARAAVARRARRRHRAQGDRAGRRRAPARARHRLLDLLPVRDAPPAARGRRAPARGAHGGRRGGADRPHRRADRGRRDGGAGRRPPRVLPRLRAGPRRHHAHHPRRRGHARPRAGGALRRAAVRRAQLREEAPPPTRAGEAARAALGPTSRSCRCASPARSPPCGARGELAREHQTPRWRLLVVARRLLAPGGDPDRARRHRAAGLRRASTCARPSSG